MQAKAFTTNSDTTFTACASSSKIKNNFLIEKKKISTIKTPLTFWSNHA